MLANYVLFGLLVLVVVIPLAVIAFRAYQRRDPGNSDPPPAIDDTPSDASGTLEIDIIVESDELLPEPAIQPPVEFAPRLYLQVLVAVALLIGLVLLFPWAVAFGQLGLSAVLAAVVVLLFLLSGLVYAWKQGLFDAESLVAPVAEEDA